MENEIISREMKRERNRKRRLRQKINKLKQRARNGIQVFDKVVTGPPRTYQKINQQTKFRKARFKPQVVKKQKDKWEIAPCTQFAIDTVINPFEVEIPRGLPDGKTQKSTILFDYIKLIPNQPISGLSWTSITAFTGLYDGSETVQYGSQFAGIFMFLLPINNLFETNDRITLDTEHTWTIGVAAVNVNGYLMPGGIDDDGNALLYVLPTNFAETFTNYVASTRLISMGMRVWPAVEILNVSDENAAYAYTGGTVDTQTLYTTYWGQPTSIATFTNADKKFSNAQGISTRYNPFEKDWQTEFQTIENLTSDICCGDTLHLPYLYIQFNNPLTVQTIDPDTFIGTLPPLNFMFESKLWCETKVPQNTPIYTRKTQHDINWEEIVKVLQSGDTYPQTVSGHSFSSFGAKVDKFVNEASKIIKQGTNVYHGAKHIIKGFK